MVQLVFQLLTGDIILALFDDIYYPNSADLADYEGVSDLIVFINEFELLDVEDLAVEKLLLFEGVIPMEQQLYQSQVVSVADQLSSVGISGLQMKVKIRLYSEASH
ncbi:MAG: hypothetical protein EZS28_039943 [Streblomastix strix]|uniref:Uncharacterized protein n=1 Tax=Streblomastix strix TaxID=222440 RepID=A0A5J4U323_9EUKA|nr:MAG: hypothetical protein EZS28_039943 [Streblomastix strix]